jgi:hypothetical protein
MRAVLTGTASIGLALWMANVPAFAQMHDNSEKQMTCNNGGYDSERARHCEIREQNVAAIGRMTVDSSPNGSATIKGWLQGGVLVRARVETSADTDGAAALLASQVAVDSGAGEVRATGPNSGNHAGWSVSYEIFVPQTTDVSLKSVNGSLTVSDVRGQLHFEVTNGSVHLKRVAGEVSGSTTNGSVQVELAGSTWEGRQMEINTHNGSVTLTTPQNFSAHVLAETGMGAVQTDFPVMVQGADKHRVEFDLGSGGPLVHVTTGNGSVRLKRAETQ